MTLRPYQQRIVDSTLTAWDWSDRVLVVAPTGSGKTVIAAAIIERYLIPMRGSELGDRPLTSTERFALFDPHEG